MGPGVRLRLPPGPSIPTLAIMSTEEFTQASFEVVVTLASTEHGGRHTPVLHAWRPDMSLVPSGQQFWGQIDAEAPIHPGTSGVAMLKAAIPNPVISGFVAGVEIVLKDTVVVGYAKILAHSRNA